MRRTPRTIAVLFVLAALSMSNGRFEAPLVAETQLAELRLYECTRTTQPPTIDGVLDDACWQHADETDAFSRTLGTDDSPPSVQTHFRIVYDEYNVYIGIRCDEPHPERLKANVTENDTVDGATGTYHGGKYILFKRK